MRLTRGHGLLVRTFIFIAALLLVAPVSLAQPSGVVKGRVLVKFKAGTTKAKSDHAVLALGAREVGELSRIGVKVLQLPESANEVASASILRDRPEVEFAEPDCIVEPSTVDPMIGSQWHINKISAPAAWLSTHGNPSVVIAVIDTGCDPTHPDLVAKYVPGWNFYDNNSNSSDVHGHGTLVAGTAAATTDNGIGVAGVSYDCKIMPLRVSSATGSGLTSLMANALTWAADRGARVANISYAVSTSSVIQSAAQYFMDRGGVVTVAAGNSGTFVATPDSPSVLAISASTANDTVATWSTTGNNIDLACPGENIFTTTRGGGYGATSGTSLSSPIAAGVAALVISANPSLSGAQARDVMKASADDIGAPGWDSGSGSGRVNASRAVALALAGPAADTQAPTVSFSTPGQNATLSGMCSVLVGAGDNVGVSSVELSFNGTSLGTKSSGPYSWTWDTCSAQNGSYTLKATARDAAGNTSSSTVTVSILNVPDSTPPTVAVMSPGAGAHVSKPTSITASAADNVGVVRVEFYVDGKLIGSSAGPSFSIGWNPKKVPKGSHTIQAKAFDAAGNYAWSTVVAVTT